MIQLKNCQMVSKHKSKIVLKFENRILVSYICFELYNSLIFKRSSLTVKAVPVRWKAVSPPYGPFVLIVLLNSQFSEHPRIQSCYCYHVFSDHPVKPK